MLLVFVKDLACVFDDQLLFYFSSLLIYLIRFKSFFGVEQRNLQFGLYTDSFSLGYLYQVYSFHFHDPFFSEQAFFISLILFFVFLLFQFEVLLEFLLFDHIFLLFLISFYLSLRVYLLIDLRTFYFQQLFIQ